jgi:hypothetical protein
MPVLTVISFGFQHMRYVSSFFLSSRWCGAGAIGLICAVAPLFAPLPALAQASGCEKAQVFGSERAAIVSRLNASAKSNKKMTPQDACAILGKLVSNGNAFLAWANTNKDWCQIPDQFVEGLSADNANANKVRGNACEAVKRQAILLERAKAAREAQQRGGAGSFGGSDAVTGGPMPVPRGAL